jgi:hypothetical protein
MDGEATTMTRGAIWARSVDGYNFGPAAHTRDWMRAFHARLSHEIPEGWRVCGENVYAKHSLYYTALPTYYYVYSIWDENKRCLSWDETEQWAELLGLYTVPVIWRGTFDREIVENMMPITPLYGESEVEGYVVRLADGFAYEDFADSLRKWVRPGHVAEGSSHWAHEQLVPNQLAPNATPWPGKLAR